MGGDDRARDGEAQSGAAAGSIARGVEPHERLEHPRHVGGRDARARVAHAQKPGPVLARHVELDETSGGRVVQGVLDEVARRAMKRGCVAQYRDRISDLHAHRHAPRLREPRADVENLERHLLEIDRRPRRREIGADATGDQQVLGEPDEPIDFFELLGQDLAIFRGRSLGPQGDLQASLERGEGRAELVRGVGREAAHRPEGALEAAEHLVECVGQPIELVASLDDGDSSRELAELLQEIAALSDKIGYVRRDDDARKPSFAINRVGTDVSVRFAGIPMGHEFTSLVLALLQVGGHPSKTAQELIEQVRGLEGEYRFETYFSLSCQNCPDVVQALNLMSVLNPNIRHVAIDGALFQDEV